MRGVSWSPAANLRRAWGRGRINKTRIGVKRVLAAAGIVVVALVGWLTLRTAGDALDVALKSTGLFGDPVSGSRPVDRMTVHHTASGPVAGERSVDVTLVAGWHRARGIGLGFRDSRACAYHFLILRDGTIQAGRPLDQRSSGTRNIDDNRRTVAVCLVGDFGYRRADARWSGMRPTEAQMRSLEGLALWAFDRYGFGPEAVRGHREVASSDCPGARFDLDSLRRRLRYAVRAGHSAIEPPLGHR